MTDTRIIAISRLFLHYIHRLLRKTFSFEHYVIQQYGSCIYFRRLYFSRKWNKYISYGLLKPSEKRPCNKKILFAIPGKCIWNSKWNVVVNGIRTLDQRHLQMKNSFFPLFVRVSLVNCFEWYGPMIQRHSYRYSSYFFSRSFQIHLDRL